MSFDRIKSFWRTSSEIIEQSILDKTQNFIASSFRRSTLPTPSTIQFDDYLSSLPHVKKQTKKSRQGSVSSLKPQLVKRCYEVVDKQYFNENYQIDLSLFEKRAKSSLQKQGQMQQQLDQVQVCLFNQISSRFDEILSVLRTIQALDLLVVQSKRKIKSIRQQNLHKVIKVSQKQNKMALLIRRKKNLQSIVQLASKLKQYKKFKQLEQQLQCSQTSQSFYTIIPIIKNNVEIYKKLKSTKNAMFHIDQAENTLKRSFAEKVNQKIFEYLKKDIPYQIQFWRRNVNSNSLMQQRGDQSKNSTALLDQSAIMVEEDSVAVLPKKQQNIQNSVLQYVRKGWEDGQYSVGKFKADIDALLKSKHNAFMLDFRNFCDEVCKKYQRHVQNPSLTNLLHQISINFCIKVYNYFFDIHKSIIMRFFSTSQKLYEFVINLSINNTQLTIDQKQKIKIMTQGFANSGSFLVRIILQKLIDIIDTKVLHEGIDISEIKQIIGVMENAQAFIQKQISLIVEISHAKDSFLSQFFNQLHQRFPVKILQTAKKRKLMDYLNKMHKNALTVQLKQSLQNQTWQPQDIPTFYYDSLHYLISGQSLNLRRNKHNLKNQQSSMMYETSVLMDNQSQIYFQQPIKHVENFRIIRNDIKINGQTYKVTQTLLLLLEMLQDYMTLGQNFPVLKTQIGIRINQIIRSYNMSSCQLIVHAGAVALQKLKTKNITSKHLALSSISLKFILYIMECIQKRIQILDYSKLRQSIEQHIQIIIKKLNQILVHKANLSKSQINLKSTPSKGTQVIVSSTKILFQIMMEFFGKQNLQILNRIFTKQVLNIYVDAITTIKVHTRVQAEALKDDVTFFFGQLKILEQLSIDFEQRRIVAEDIVRKAFEQL